MVYEFYEMGAPETDGHLAFGSSITYPGKVGNEYFMTKGHFIPFWIPPRRITAFGRGLHAD